MQKSDFPKPRVVFSSCLAGERVRYDGKLVSDELAEKLRSCAEVLKVCPEVELGLGVPRNRLILYRGEGGIELIQPSTGANLTADMQRFAGEFLGSLLEVDGFLLKGKSPSCAFSGARIYRDSGGKTPIGRGRGLFAREVLRRYPFYPVGDEITLRERGKRQRFLLLIFALAELRRTGDTALFHRRVSELLKNFAPMTEAKLRGERNPFNYRIRFLRAARKIPTDSLRTALSDLLPAELKDDL